MAARQAAGAEDTELAQALRQCDGEHVQCVVMVRDDFWLALSRFMGDLHIELVQGQNTALVDLFDPIHARKVLAAFGRALRASARRPERRPEEQEAFLDQAVDGLAQDGRVISVRLALFAEMVKGKPWTPATLKEVGGTEGVGVAFLEETFSARPLLPNTAPPEGRPGRAEGPAARERHATSRATCESARGTARSVGLRAAARRISTTCCGSSTARSG